MVNPDRGLYQWISKNLAPVQTIDSYTRYNWSQLETACNVYNFSRIRSAAAAASNKGGKFGFGIMPMLTGTTMAYPGYLHSNMPLKWWSASNKCWVPDWNDSYYLSRVDALASNLGAAFDKDPRVGYVDVRAYGNWGEWHVSRFEAPTNGAPTVTNASLASMVSSYAKYFPNTQVIMMSDNPVGLSNAMCQKITQIPMGWRRDSWGSSIMNHVSTGNAWPAASNRWMTAPVIVESIAANAWGGVDSNVALAQVGSYHVSRIGNGNFWGTSNWSDVPKGLQTAILDSAAAAGYIYSVSSVQYPTTFASAAGSNQVQSTWSNIGNAPTYHPWQLQFRLINTATSQVYPVGTSSLSLKSLMPNTGVQVSDVFGKAPCHPGTYLFDLTVSDPEGYYKSMNIAITAPKNAYGGYTVASNVTVV
jgi:hypothetical protein